MYFSLSATLRWRSVSSGFSDEERAEDVARALPVGQRLCLGDLDPRLERDTARQAPRAVVFRILAQALVGDLARVLERLQCAIVIAGRNRDAGEC